MFFFGVQNVDFHNQIFMAAVHGTTLLENNQRFLNNILIQNESILNVLQISVAIFFFDGPLGLQAHVKNWHILSVSEEYRNLPIQVTISSFAKYLQQKTYRMEEITF